MIKVFIKKTMNNVKLDEVEEKLNDYITTPKKKIDFCFINCELK